MNAKHKGGMSALLVQIEYYFCDLNIIQDKFLLGVIETQNGFVPIDTLLGFVKVKELTTSAEEIVKAVETSKTLVLSEDKKSIKRVKPIPTEAEVNERSLFVKGFEEKTTREQILEFINAVAKVECIKMNYNRLKEVNTFNTTVFVEFETKEEMEKFLAAKLKFGENEIVAKPRSEKSKNKSNNKKKPDHINLKLVISDKTINKDFKNAVKNNQILRDNVVKYFVERSASERNLCTAVPTKTEEKVATEKVEEQKPVEMVEEKADEKKEEKAEEKTEKVQTTKNAFLALKKNEDLEKVKEALAGLKFHGMGVVVQECTEEDSNKIATFSIPTKSKSRTFKRKPRND